MAKLNESDVKKSELWQQGLIAAKYVNAHVVVPSNCYRLDKVPQVKFIICGTDLVSVQIARQLAKAITDRYETEPLIVSSKEWRSLDSNTADSAEIRKLLVKNVFKPWEALLITTQVLYNELVKFTCFAEAYFCIRERYLDNKANGFKYAFCDGKGNLSGQKTIKNYDCLSSYGYDMTVQIELAKAYWELMEIYGPNGPSGKRRKVICTANKKEMPFELNRILFPRHPELTKAQIQALTLNALGIQQEDITVWEHQQDEVVNLETLSFVLSGESCLMCVPQRLSALVYAAKEAQHPEMKLEFKTIFEKTEEIMKWMNGLAADDGKIAFDFLGRVLDAWEECAAEGKMIPIEGIDEVTRKNGRFLIENFASGKSKLLVVNLFKKDRIVEDLRKHTDDVREDYKQRIAEAREFITRRYGKVMEEDEPRYAEFAAQQEACRREVMEFYRYSY